MTSSAAVKGEAKNLVPEVPTFIASLTVVNQKRNADKAGMQKPASIHCTAKEIGVRGVVGEWVLECPNQTRVVCDGIRFVRYSRQFSAKEKYPYYRLLWKPDISRLNDSSARQFVAQNTTADPSVERELISVLDLYVHRDPAIRILQIGGPEMYTRRILHILNANTQFKRFKTLAILAADGGHMLDIISEDVNIYKNVDDLEEKEAGCFNLIIVPEVCLRHESVVSMITNN